MRRHRPRRRSPERALPRGRKLRALTLAAVLLGALVILFSEAAAAAHPDFSGIWGTYRAPGQAPRGRRLGPSLADLPLTPAGRAKAEAYHNLVDPKSELPGGFCLGYGMPGAMLLSGGYPMEIVQRDDLILVVYEAYEELRWIYLENRVKDSDLFPERDGYSFGRWEGDKLVVETTHLTESLDQRQFPHGDRARIREEYELEKGADGGKVLVAHMTLTDPDFYTKPVTAEKKWSFVPGGRLLPYQCNEPSWEEHLEKLRGQGAAAGAGPRAEAEAGEGKAGTPGH